MSFHLQNPGLTPEIASDVVLSIDEFSLHSKRHFKAKIKAPQLYVAAGKHSL